MVRCIDVFGRRVSTVSAAPAFAIMALLVSCSVGASAAAAKTLFVSPRGKLNAACTKPKPCRTLVTAVGRAHRGDEVLVAHGVYREGVTVARDIRLVGSGKPIIDATGAANGVLVTGKSAAGALVRGFLIRNATFEGVLLANTKGVTIERNTVTGNDLGGSAAKPEGECAPQGVIPGDCGEGLHLMGVTQARIVENVVNNNAGGILLTDETGPTARNTVARNRVTKNVLDCGITLAGHSPKALVLSAAPGPPTMTGLAPSLAGIYSNLITGNTVDGNGTKGQGGGILLAAGPPGTGVYNNTVRGNIAQGNGLAGITLHSHAPGQDLSGNVITHNILSNDGVAGGPGGTPGDMDAGVTHSVGILLWSAVTPLTGMSVTGNVLSNDYYGIWTKNAPKISSSENTFTHTVTVPLTQG
jgi:parallel beta-helix repeat protein